MSRLRHRLCARTKVAASTSLLLLAVITFGGCAHFTDWMHNGFKVGPNYKQPAVPISDQWIDFNDRKVISEGFDDSQWWAVFGDEKLNTLVQATYSENLDLREAALRVMEAQARRGIAVGEMFPQAQTANFAYQRVQFSQAGNQLGVLPLPRAIDFFNTGLSTSWELDIWGKYRRAVESADAEIDAAIEDYDDILVCLLAETAASYIEIRAFQERLVYARNNVEAQQEAVRLAKARFDAGAVSELDVKQAESLLGNTEALIPELERGLRESNNNLCTLLGIPTRDLTPELGEAQIPDSPSEVAVGIPAELIRRRPDIRQAEREVAAQSARIGIAAADLFPEFRISGTLSYQANNFSDLFTSPAQGGNVGPSINWNILNYGRIANNIRVQDAVFQQLAVSYQNAVIEANAEVENAIVGFLKAQDRVVSLHKAVDATERSLELVNKQYREGETDLDRVVNVLRDLARQQDSLAIAEADIAINLIQIYKRLGGGWQIREMPHAGMEMLQTVEGVPAGSLPLPMPPLPGVDLPMPQPQG